MLGLTTCQVCSTGGKQMLTANDLAAADIVLTTYNTLRMDLNHHWADTENNSRKLRSAKRYLVWPTPLTRVKWWRVCFDEVQMVENSAAKATEMARNLDAIHRWRVATASSYLTIDRGAKPQTDYPVSVWMIWDLARVPKLLFLPFNCSFRCLLSRLVSVSLVVLSLLLCLCTRVIAPMCKATWLAQSI